MWSAARSRVVEALRPEPLPYVAENSSLQLGIEISVSVCACGGAVGLQADRLTATPLAFVRTVQPTADSLPWRRMEAAVASSALPAACQAGGSPR